MLEVTALQLYQLEAWANILHKHDRVVTWPMWLVTKTLNNVNESTKCLSLTTNTQRQYLGGTYKHEYFQSKAQENTLILPLRSCRSYSVGIPMYTNMVPNNEAVQLAGTVYVGNSQYGPQSNTRGLS